MAKYSDAKLFASEVNFEGSFDVAIFEHFGSERFFNNAAIVVIPLKSSAYAFLPFVTY